MFTMNINKIFSESVCSAGRKICEKIKIVFATTCSYVFLKQIFHSQSSIYSVYVLHIGHDITENDVILYF